MATSTEVCAVCDLQHQTTLSTYWCIECEESLCSTCKQHHHLIKASRNHKTIPISDYRLLPAVVTDIQQHCVYHNEIYQLYCIKHESPICNKCVKDHGKCGEILSLDEKVKDIKTSEYFVDLEQSLDDLYSKIDELRTNRELNIERLTDQKKKIAAKACHLKNQVIQHVSKLEEEFIKELNQIEFYCCNPINSIVSSLQHKAKEINEIKSDIQNTKKYASDLQSFLSICKIQTKTTEFEKHLQSSFQNEYHEEINIESAADTAIYDFLTVERLGSIKVKKIPSSKIALNKRKDKQAQIMVPRVIQLINNVKLEFKQKLNTNSNQSTGCCFTNKGEFLFTDVSYNAQLIAINGDGEVELTIPFDETYGAYDVACLDTFTVAVSTGYSGVKSGISIVDLTKRKVIKFIDLYSFPSGITHDGKSLICCVVGEDLNVISCTDYTITTIPHTASLCYSNVSTHADKIFFTTPGDNKVTCCLYSGSLVWEFMNKNVLDRPQGITVDNSGNVFVVGTKSCNVVCIAPDGKQYKQILTKKDGLVSPTAIAFEKVRMQLLVTNYEQYAYVYNISYSEMKHDTQKKIFFLTLILFPLLFSFFGFLRN